MYHNFLFLLRNTSSILLVSAMVDLLLLIVLCYLFTDPVLDKHKHKHIDEGLETARSSGFFSKVCEMFSSPLLPLVRVKSVETVAYL